MSRGRSCLQRVDQAVVLHASLVEGNANDACAGGLEDLQRARPGRHFGDDAVARLQQRRGDERDRLLRAAGHEDVVRRGVETVLPQIVREPVPQRRIAGATFRSQRRWPVAIEDVAESAAKLGHGNEPRIARAPGETDRIVRQRAAEHVAEGRLPFHVDRMHEVALPGRQGGRRGGGRGFAARGRLAGVVSTAGGRRCRIRRAPRWPPPPRARRRR